MGNLISRPTLIFTALSFALSAYLASVYEDGRVLSLVANAGSHGTHVAAIVGANFPECADKNGIAPGVQMISGALGCSPILALATNRRLKSLLIVTAEQRRFGVL
jgi:tripeptidyl-peptidase-2